MQRVWMVVMAAAVALVGCATELDPGGEPHPGAQANPNGFRFVVPHYDTPSGELPDPSELPDDPCDCPDEACIDDWAAENLSCDVCVVLLCDGEWHPHVCHLCSDTE